MLNCPAVVHAAPALAARAHAAPVRGVAFLTTLAPKKGFVGGDLFVTVGGRDRTVVLWYLSPLLD